MRYVKRAIEDYEMIAPGDKIAVGVSGGKDSVALLRILAHLRDYSHLSFSMVAIMIDPGWKEVDIGPLADFCSKFDIPFYLVKHPIARIIAAKGENNPCSLCAKLRSGLLYSKAVSLGCRRVALGHHLDDVIETFFLNLVHAGYLRTFRPVVYLERMGIHLIRPFSYVPESALVHFVAREGLPVLPPLCPYAGKTQRAAMKEIVEFIAQRYPYFRERFRTALQNVSLADLWKQRRPKDDHGGLDL
ncbi:PP-loop domain protein [Ammonifex degensii KC4]|uniref:PP-loop domain protein n=1 Tax=Ammonifex degensii (strain DSM 10501 / KC4) TaxID=429009 RepID=C9R922_AMMDK|nr:ATP-binding protein [Ammonifex degensii]ACX52801.1 PP-loop domain protein [Ammonifex degensii KC4]